MYSAFCRVLENCWRLFYLNEMFDPSLSMCNGFHCISFVTLCYSFEYASILHQLNSFFFWNSQKIQQITLVHCTYTTVHHTPPSPPPPHTILTILTDAGEESKINFLLQSFTLVYATYYGYSRCGVHAGHGMCNVQCTCVSDECKFRINVFKNI